MRKPFAFLLKRRVTCQRNTPTKDASGGDVDSWANLAGAVNVKACRWQKKMNDNDTGFARLDGIAEYEYAFASDLGLRAGDRIADGADYAYVQGVPFDATNDGLGAGPYVVKTHIRQSR